MKPLPSREFSVHSDSLGVWFSAAAVAASLISVLGLLALIAVKGLGHFWPSDVQYLVARAANGDDQRLIGEISGREWVPRARLSPAEQAQLPAHANQAERLRIKIGNREHHGLDFRWVLTDAIRAQDTPPELTVLERLEWGRFYGYPVALLEDGRRVASEPGLWDMLRPRLEPARDLREQIRRIEHNELKTVHYRLERLRLREQRWRLAGALDTSRQATLAREHAALRQQIDGLEQELHKLRVAITRDAVVMRTMDGVEQTIPLAGVVAMYRPNAMTWTEKFARYLGNLWRFVASDPREANTEGGVFPAIFGTVIMVILMSVMVTPLGVLAAVYLSEYARQDWRTRLVRGAVNNLAGVPSVVYGVFGLGFFVYFVGGSMDRLFFPEAAPAPVFGTGGVLWASLTLALLTLPVVIVATEEGLSRIPPSIREGSLALGATQAETLWRTVLPIASPAMMTGLILAIARAAGEVAPLMLVGVVKMAPSLPIDGESPFIHLERKFMHLGFHIYDIGFQSPNAEAARPLVFATAFLLVLVVVVLNLTAIWFRARLSARYRALETAL